ncbi:unnamed protein product [Cyclocybe aegerita]|uniref:Ubiquinol-cytochrome C reductase hinge domain-containing protein n=1 Tax=Cyclocybe aegerita TaxID=1973307 RepID=A0A8S0VUL4_CYCAE|nr:unnamed protein product [Cyclocybe aegerita]
MASIASFFSSFISTTHADSEEKAAADTEVVVEEQAEEEEPEDLQPVIRDECKASAKCAALTKHFEHCQEKVSAGEGFKGEDCVEELPVSPVAEPSDEFKLRRIVSLSSMMHCVDDCAGPKLFAKLR